MASPKTIARTAGALYLLLVLLGVWAEFAVRRVVHVPGDAAATADRIAGHITLFRLGIAADILMAVVFVLLGLALYRLLHPVHRRAATALLVLVTAGAGIIVLNLAFQAGALLVATDPAYATAFEAGQRDAIALLLLDLHSYGYVLGGVFFGLWLLPAGYAAYRSELFPSWLGVLVLAAGAAWLADPVLAIGFPGVPGAVRDIVSVPTSIGEFTLLGYLLVRGVRSAAGQRHAAPATV
jgi:hypothetical protein